MTVAAASALCVHCGNKIPSADFAPFCCVGCRAVHALLQSEHLERFYELRGERGVAIPAALGSRRDLHWLDAIIAKQQKTQGIARIDLDLQGLHCSGCVWLIEKIFSRHAGGDSLSINPSLGRAHLFVDKSFDLRAFVSDVEQFGYLFGPPLKKPRSRASDLTIRMGICIALAMNAMIFAIAIYAGLREGPTFELMQRWSLVLSIASVVIGGSVFFRSAWAALRRGVLHLDLPIALGIGLAFGGSLYGFAVHRDGGVFIDTLDVFIALMLVGRFLQERVLDRNRLALLESDGAEGLLTRRVRDGSIETIRCMEVRAGDEIALSPGELVPVEAALAKQGASFSLDWINGESRARAFEPGAIVPAGAFLGGSRAVSVVAREDFAESPLLDLLRTPANRRADETMSAPWWDRITRIYVVLVLAAAALGFAAWFFVTRDVARSLEITTAVLVVTCPCAFGIATPLGYDLVLAGLRRAGLYVRSAGFLERAEHVHKVVFDKTGTLTTGALRLASREPIAFLSPSQRRVLAAMVAASHHPKAVAIRTALAFMGIDANAVADVEEISGRGLALVIGDDEYRLGAPAWATRDECDEAADLAFAVDGRLLTAFTTTEKIRPDAATEVHALRDAGYDVWLLSGDEVARVAQTVREAGIENDHGVGCATPSAKEEFVAVHDDHDLLMVGDGINDSLAVARAFCSGTPAIDRPFMAAKSDFYFVTPGLRCIRLALSAAKKLGRVRRRNLRLALAYNVLGVSLAYAGLMSPLACAVFMPLTSLTTILMTSFSLGSRSALWRS